MSSPDEEPLDEDSASAETPTPPNEDEEGGDLPSPIDMGEVTNPGRQFVPPLSAFHDIVRMSYLNPIAETTKALQGQLNVQPQVFKLVEQQEQWRRRWLESMRIMPQVTVPQVTLPQLHLTPMVDLLQRTLEHLDYYERVDVEKFEPDNWAGLHDSFRLRRLVRLADDGYPITWVPRPTVIEALHAADDDARVDALLDQRQLVIEDCAEVVDQLRGNGGQWEEQAELLDELVRMAQNGFLRAGQPTSAAVLDVVIREVFEPPPNAYRWKYPHAVDAVEKAHPWAVPAKAVRTVCTFLRLPALFETWEFPTDGIPGHYHRHATAHAIGRTQCTEGNALIALMLAVSAVREAHELGGQTFADIIAELNEDDDES